VRARSTLTTDLDGLYAAQRLSMVRLALLLVGDRDVAEAIVQRAFLGLLRRTDRRRVDRGVVVAELRTRVVMGCRAVRRRRRPDMRQHALGHDTYGDVLGLPRRECEVVVLEVWGRLTRPQVASTLRIGERTVAAVRAAAIDSLRRPEEPDDTHTRDRVAEALERRADAIGAEDLRWRFSEVVDEDTRRTAQHRRWWLLAVAVVIVVAAAVAVQTGVQRYTGPAPPPVPAPLPSEAQVTSPLSSPALAPGERPRAAIPWGEVGPGWAVIATATPATAITTTLLLVSPQGTRYGLGSAPESMVIQDVSADARHLIVAVGSRAQEWDLPSGTARELVTPYGWKTLRYTGPDPSYGYLVLWTDSTSSSVHLERWTSDGNLRTEYDTVLASTAGSPRHPGVVVSPDGSSALLSSRDGPLQLLDFATDTVASPGPFDEAPTCEPLGDWSATEAVVGCGSSVQVNAYNNLVGRPLLVTPAGGTSVRVATAWQTAGPDVVQLDDFCSPSFGSILFDRRIAPMTTGGIAEGLVPNQAVGRTVFLGGTRCAMDGDRLVAYDVATRGTTELAGPDAGGRTVRQAVVVVRPH
jgi:hypothetical protein